MVPNIFLTSLDVYFSQLSISLELPKSESGERQNVGNICTSFITQTGRARAIITEVFGHYLPRIWVIKRHSLLSYKSGSLFGVHPKIVSPGSLDLQSQNGLKENGESFTVRFAGYSRARSLRSGCGLYRQLSLIKPYVRFSPVKVGLSDYLYRVAFADGERDVYVLRSNCNSP